MNIAKKILRKIPDRKYLSRDNIRLFSKQLTRKLRNNYNVVIISIDTLRKDHLGCYGYHRNTTSNIDRLAHKGVIFNNAFSNSAWTVPGHMSMLTGLLPSNHGLIYYPYPGCINDNITTLGMILQRLGFLTRGFYGAGYVSPRFGFGRGFHEYTTGGNNFENNMQQCLGWVEKAKSFRFMLFLHGFNCHNPFNPSPEFDIFSKNYNGNYSVDKLYREYKLPECREDIEHLIDKYDATILGADFILGKLFNKLEELKILSKTIIIITSDHGHGFGEHESFGHVTQLYDEVINIPLIFYAPGIFPEKKKIGDMVSLIDILPTIIDALGFKEAQQFDGLSLLPVMNGRSIEDRAIFSETGTTLKKKSNKKRGLPKRYMLPIVRCIRTKEWKLIIDENDMPLELYNVMDDMDEKLNLVESHPDMAGRLLKQFCEQGPTRKAQELIAPQNKNDYDEELKQQLQALGYL